MFKKINNYFKDKSFIEILPWIWLVVSYLLTYVVIYVKGRYYIDADMASEMVLANQLNKDGALIFGNWFYSSEIRIFYLQLIFRFTLLLFPNNWYLARVIGLALWMLILLFSYFFVCGSKGLNLKNKGVLGAVCLASPLGICYFMYAVWGGYYMPHMILILLSLGLVIRLYKYNDKKSNIIYGFLLVLVCFINGLGSVKSIMALYLPLCLASLIILIYKQHVDANEKPNVELRLLCLSVITLIASGIGYVLNSKVLSQRYMFATYHSRSWANLDLSKFLDTIGDFLSLFGYQHPGYWDSLQVDLFSINGILGAFSLVTIGLLIISVIILIKKYKNLNFDLRFIFTLFLSLILVQACVFAFTEGTDVAGAVYWITPLPIAFIVMTYALEYVDFKQEYSKKLISLILLISISLTSVASVNSTFERIPKAKPSLESVFNFLKKNNYTQGYATFWNGNVLTEWSNGDIEVWTAYDFASTNFLQIYKWLQNKEHLTNIPEGKLFLLTSNDELKSGKSTSILKYSDAVYEDENGYIVLYFDSYDDLVDTAKEAGLTIVQ